MSTDFYNLEAYPEIMTKEQLRIACHISKRKAMYLLQNGLIPCINTGKKTHTYLIKKSDVLAYLQNRELHPENYLVLFPREPHGNQRINANLANLWNAVSPDRMRSYYTKLLGSFPDLLTVMQVRVITGYNENTIHNWIHHGHLRYLDCIVGWRIPKVWLIDFLCSPYCNGIARKTDLHVSFIADMIQAADMMDTLVKQMAEARGVNEQLKANDWWRWMQEMGNIKNAAEEIVLREVVYT